MEPAGQGRLAGVRRTALAGGLHYDLGAHLIDQAVLLFVAVRSVRAALDVRREGANAHDVFVAR